MHPLGWSSQRITPALAVKLMDNSSTGSEADEDEFARLECSAEAKHQAIEGHKDEEEDEVDEKSPVDFEREYNDNNKIDFL